MVHSHALYLDSNVQGIENIMISCDKFTIRIRFVLHLKKNAKQDDNYYLMRSLLHYTLKETKGFELQNAINEKNKPKVNQ